MKTLFLFYSSWALSSWGDRLWYFALSMYFIVINKNSLLITAISGLSANIVSIFFGAVIGNIIDRNQRINIVRVSLLVQNLTVGIACSLVIFLLVFDEFCQSTWDGWFFYAVQAVIILVNMVGSLASMAMKISVERDWVIVITKSELAKESESSDSSIDSTKKFKDRLANVNAILRAINLTTGIVGPLAAGTLMSLFNLSGPHRGTIISALCFALWNFGSCFVEYFFLRAVYQQVPDLAKKTLLELTSTPTQRPSNPISTIYSSWWIYIKQGVLVLPGVAFALLFLTVLGFDSITLGYAKSQNLSEIFIAFFQAIGSLTGIFGTLAFPFLHNRLKIFLPYIALIGSGYQITFLVVCLLAVWLPGSPFILASTFDESYVASNDSGVSCVPTIHGITGSPFEKFLFEPSCHPYTSIIVFLAGMTMSRFGLWLTDLATNQIMQESVDEDERGTVAGVQNSLNQIFDLFKFVLVISLSDISYYGFLVIISVFATFLSGVLYTVFALKEKSRLEYSQEPISEAGPFRKSMIQIVNRNNNDQVDNSPQPNNNADINSIYSWDSFDEEPPAERQ